MQKEDGKEEEEERCITFERQCYLYGTEEGGRGGEGMREVGTEGERREYESIVPCSQTAIRLEIFELEAPYKP